MFEITIRKNTFISPLPCSFVFVTALSCSENGFKRQEGCSRRQGAPHGTFHRRSSKLAAEISRRPRESSRVAANSSLLRSRILHDEQVNFTGLFVIATRSFYVCPTNKITLSLHASTIVRSINIIHGYFFPCNFKHEFFLLN